MFKLMLTRKTPASGFGGGALTQLTAAGNTNVRNLRLISSGANK
jgi:hypothetical protein